MSFDKDKGWRTVLSGYAQGTSLLGGDSNRFAQLGNTILWNLGAGGFLAPIREQIMQPRMKGRPVDPPSLPCIR